MHLFIFGGSGMLGKRVVSQARERGHTVFAPDHNSHPIQDSLDSLRWLSGGKDPDVIINCAGVCPPSSAELMIPSNSIGPHKLSSFGFRLIHMSTDCVYSGRKSGWLDAAKDNPDPIDLYGGSKLAGEPAGERVLVVRGSFIGPEHGFLRWLLDAKGTVKAWMNAIWNGGSADRMAEALLNLAEGDLTGVIHVAAADHVTKAWMVEYLIDALNLPLSVEIVKEPQISRALWPDVTLPHVKQSLDELISQLNGEDRWTNLKS